MFYLQTDDAAKALRRLGQDLSAGQLNTAQSRAINRSLEKGRTIARKEIKKVYNIPQRYLKDVDYKRASPNNLTGKLFASRKPIPLDAFAPKQETGSGSISITKKGAHKVRSFRKLKANPTAGVSIEVKKGDREVLPYAFMIAGGAVRVFARGEYKTGTDHGFVLRHQRVKSTGNDTPIKPLITVSEFGSIINPVVINRIGRDVKVFYSARLEHEIMFVIQQAARAANNP